MKHSISTVLSSLLKQSAFVVNLFVLCILVVAVSVHAEEPPEGIDFIGGYYENGEYKCYSEPCFSIHKGTEAAAERIRPFDRRDWRRTRGSCQRAYTKALAQTSEIEISYAKKGDCVFVTKGLWIDAYTDQKMENLKTIALDQRVSYKEAHRYGAAYWTPEQRMNFMDDASNLVPVALEQKRTRDGRSPSQWMPENKKYWCDYIVHRELTLRKYNLFLPKVEREFHKRVKTLYCKY